MMKRHLLSFFARRPRVAKALPRSAIAMRRRGRWRKL